MKFLILLIFCSCSGLTPKTLSKNNKKIYSFYDVTGKYKLTRESIFLDNKIVTRTFLQSSQESNEKILEKSVTVSQIGTIKDKKNRTLAVRPFASEFDVWLEGKKYSSQMNLNGSTKSMQIDLDSPESKWKGRQNIKFPKGSHFCFFSQLAECLYYSHTLEKSLKHRSDIFRFYVVWDNFPFVQEQISGVGDKLFSSASVRFESEERSALRFTIDVNGQTLIYQFSKSFELVRMFWIANGISILPYGEEINEDD